MNAIEVRTLPSIRRRQSSWTLPLGPSLMDSIAKKLRKLSMSSILTPKHHCLSQYKIHAGAHRDIISLRKEYICRGLHFFNDTECHCCILRPVDSLFVPDRKSTRLN